MSLLDGKYEIISQQSLEEQRTLFEATAPDGETVHIVWYDLGAEQEASFEHYRRTLKRLKRADLAALYDVVSRPGAHYVAWYPPDGTRSEVPDEALAEALQRSGYAPSDADVRRNGRQGRLYGLAFDGTPPPSSRLTPAPERSARPPAPRLRELPAWALSAAVTAVLLLATAALLSLGFALRANDRLVVVPDLLGNDVNAAAETLYRLRLEVDPVAVASNSDAGTVTKLEPGVGAQLRPGRTVRLSYALPAGQVTPTEVPRLLTLQYPDEVAGALERAGLDLGAVARIPSSQSEGLVIAQSVPAGSQAGRGSTVDVLVSAGPATEMTFIPDLVGLDVTQARDLAAVAGLAPAQVVEDEVSGDAAAGTVLAQSLRAYLPVPRDEAVLRLVVARGEPGAAPAAGVPSLVGMTLDDARSVAGGYTVAVEEAAIPSLPEGVIDQRPGPGEARGDGRLTVVVNAHPRPIPRPRPSAIVRRPSLREVSYTWYVEPGIPQQVARVYAHTLDGDSVLVERRDVQGGETIRGSWLTDTPGPVTFRLTLNGQPYGGELLAN